MRFDPSRLRRVTSSSALLVTVSLLVATPLLVATSLLVATPSLARTDPAVPAFGLGVTPTRVVIPPAELSQPHKFTVVSVGSAPFDVVIEKSDFTADRAGAMVLRPSGPNSAINWLTTDVDHFTLAPGESRVVTFSVQAPDGPEPGDHVAALVFTVPAPNDGGSIRINRAIAVPVYVTAPGAMDPTTIVSDLRAPRFSAGGPITIETTLTVRGNVHRDFRGATPLTATANGRTVTFPAFTILRGSTGDASTTWEDPPLFCVCDLSVSLTNHGVVSRRTVHIVIIPVRLLTVLFGLAVVIGVALWFARRLRRGGRPAHRAGH